jgi:hypothetical protein
MRTPEPPAGLDIVAAPIDYGPPPPTFSAEQLALLKRYHDWLFEAKLRDPEARAELWRMAHRAVGSGLLPPSKPALRVVPPDDDAPPPRAA